jgi:flagellar motor switch protein FliG
MSMTMAKLTGRQKAAIFLMALGPEDSASVLRELDEPEIERLTLEVLNMKSVPREVHKAVIEEGYELSLGSRLLNTGGVGYAREMLAEALGENRAREIVERLVSSMRSMPFDFLKGTDPAQLANLIQAEQPQAIALILAHLPPTTASKVLTALPPELQPEVAMRIATMGQTLPDVIKGVEAVVQQRLSRVVTSDTTTVGGVDYLAKILTSVDRSAERGIVSFMEEHDPELADSVHKLLFKFEDLVRLDDASLQRVLREIDNRDLGLALRNANNELKERIFKNMSSRAAELLKDEMAVGGGVRLKQVDEAQQRIVNVARRLDEAGEILIARGDDDVVV